MERRYIESTNLETAQRLAMIILEKSDIQSMSVSQIANKFITLTTEVYALLDKEYA